MEEKKVNYWKWAFLILLGVVFGSSIFLGTRIFANREPDFAKVPAITQRQGDPVLTINTNKEKVNQMISFFLTDYQKDQGIQYKFYLETICAMYKLHKNMNSTINMTDLYNV